MNGLASIWLVFILALNFGVSWLNARTCGRAWVESKAVGGSIRFLVWCGAIQSAIGFSSVFLLPLLFVANAIAPEYFTGDQLTIIVPALGTGLLITIESWIAAYRERSLANIGVAAYNTLVQVHNTMGAINSFGPALNAVGKAFSSVAASRGDAKGKAAVLGIMIAVAVVAISLSAGVVLTAALIHRYAATVPLPGPARAPTASKAVV